MQESKSLLDANEKPLKQSEIESLKQNRAKEISFKKTINQLIIQILFLIVLYNVSNSTQDPNSFKYQDSLMKNFINSRSLNQIQFNKAHIFFKVHLIILKIIKSYSFCR